MRAAWLALRREREETLHPSPPSDISRFVEWFVILTHTCTYILYREHPRFTPWHNFSIGFPSSYGTVWQFDVGPAWKHTFRGTLSPSLDPRIEGGRNWTNATATRSIFDGGRSFMDYDYILKKKKRKTGGRKRAEERSKKPGLSRAGDPWRETTSSEKNGWAANRATHGALSGYFAFYLTVPWRATRFNRLRS